MELALHRGEGATKPGHVRSQGSATSLLIWQDSPEGLHMVNPWVERSDTPGYDLPPSITTPDRVALSLPQWTVRPIPGR